MKLKPIGGVSNVPYRKWDRNDILFRLPSVARFVTGIVENDFKIPAGDLRSPDRTGKIHRHVPAKIVCAVAFDEEKAESVSGIVNHRKSESVDHRPIVITHPGELRRNNWHVVQNSILSGRFFNQVIRLFQLAGIMNPDSVFCFSKEIGVV